MPRYCMVCRHELSSDIEEALRAGVSLRALSRLIGLNKDSLMRHRRGHMDTLETVASIPSLAQEVDREERFSDDQSSIPAANLSQSEVLLDPDSETRQTGSVEVVEQSSPQTTENETDGVSPADPNQDWILEAKYPSEEDRLSEAGQVSTDRWADFYDHLQEILNSEKAGNKESIRDGNRT